LAEAGVTGVAMPAIDFAIKHPRPFDARAMMEEGLSVALATDMCPGGWTESMQFAMVLACRVYSFSPEEAVYTATAGGARALALTDRGTLEPGKLADLIAVSGDPLAEPELWRDPARIVFVMQGGRVVADRRGA